MTQTRQEFSQVVSHEGTDVQQKVTVITEHDGDVWMSLEHNGEQLLMSHANFIKFLVLLTDASAAQTK